MMDISIMNKHRLKSNLFIDVKNKRNLTNSIASPDVNG